MSRIEVTVIKELGRKGTAGEITSVQVKTPKNKLIVLSVYGPIKIGEIFLVDEERLKYGL